MAGTAVRGVELTDGARPAFLLLDRNLSCPGCDRGDKGDTKRKRQHQGGTEEVTRGDRHAFKGDLCHPCHTRLSP
jgi:hypothetical protein